MLPRGCDTGEHHLDGRWPVMVDEKMKNYQERLLLYELGPNPHGGPAFLLKHKSKGVLYELGMKRTQGFALVKAYQDRLLLYRLGSNPHRGLGLVVHT